MCWKSQGREIVKPFLTSLRATAPFRGGGTAPRNWCSAHGDFRACEVCARLGHCPAHRITVIRKASVSSASEIVPLPSVSTVSKSAFATSRQPCSLLSFSASGRPSLSC